MKRIRVSLFSLGVLVFSIVFINFASCSLGFWVVSQNLINFALFSLGFWVFVSTQTLRRPWQARLAAMDVAQESV